MILQQFHEHFCSKILRCNKLTKVSEVLKIYGVTHDECLMLMQSERMGRSFV